MPGSVYSDPEVMAKKDIITRKDMMKVLPPFGAVAEQLEIMVRYSFPLGLQFMFTCK
jgi:hypothetical protein